MENFTEGLAEPVSPMGQVFDDTFFSLYILAFLEFEVPIHDMPMVSLLKDAFFSIPRFTSIMVCDEKGVKRWKRVEVKWEEHLIEPKFMEGMSVDSYDKHFANYLSRIGMEKLPQTKPLWQVHVIKYPTRNAEGTLVFKIHHAIGDGYTLMGLLLSTLQRADDPSLPLSFPSSKSSKPENSHKFINIPKRMPHFLSMAFNSVTEFGRSLLKSTLVEDDKTPIRSGIEAIEFQPTKISKVTFPIDHINEIKSNLGVETAKHIHKTFKNSSLTITNMIGPLEKMAFANLPIRGCFFTLSGAPQSLVIAIISYMGMLRLTIRTEEGFIDEQKLVWYLNNAYEIIRREAAKVNIPE